MRPLRFEISWKQRVFAIHISARDKSSVNGSQRRFQGRAGKTFFQTSSSAARSRQKAENMKGRPFRRAYPHHGIAKLIRPWIDQRVIWHVMPLAISQSNPIAAPRIGGRPLPHSRRVIDSAGHTPSVYLDRQTVRDVATDAADAVLAPPD